MSQTAASGRRPGAVDRFGNRLLGCCLVLVLAGLLWPSAPVAEAGPVPAQPVRLSIPALGLRAPVVPIEVDPDGVLHPPEEVDRVGWWQRSARPGEPRGQLVLTGHSVHRGTGVLDDLTRLEVGAEIRVRTAAGVLAYEVTELVVYSRQQVADRARSLFGQQREDPRLVLVTCTDWVDGEYQRNVIAFARPTGSARSATRAAARADRRPAAPTG